MSESSAPARPGPVTVAGWMVVVGSVVVVLTSFETVASVHSLETREAVRKFLSEPPGDGLTITVPTALELLRISAMVAAACASAAAILGWFVLQRHRTARVVLTVLALPLFLAGMVTGGLMATVVAVAAVMLWAQPARDWFNGVSRPQQDAREGRSRGQGQPSEPPRPGEAEPGHPTDRPQQGPGAVPGPDSGDDEPRPWSGFGTAATAVRTPESTITGTAGAAPRPGSVTLACVLTWLFSGITILLTASTMVVVAVEPDLVMEELRRQQPELLEQGVTQSMVFTAVYVTGGIILVWALAAVVLAVLVVRRVAWARVALLVSAGLAAVFSLLAAISSLVLVVLLAVCLFTVSCLVRPEARDWFARR